MNRKQLNKFKRSWRKTEQGLAYVYGSKAKKAHTERWNRDPVNVARKNAKMVMLEVEKHRKSIKESRNKAFRVPRKLKKHYRSSEKHFCKLLKDTLKGGSDDNIMV